MGDHQNTSKCVAIAVHERFLFLTININSETDKRLLLGFDARARAIEVITDTGSDGQVFVIHADKITKQYEKLIEEVLK